MPEVGMVSIKDDTLGKQWYPNYVFGHGHCLHQRVDLVDDTSYTIVLDNRFGLTNIESLVEQVNNPEAGNQLWKTKTKGSQERGISYVLRPLLRKTFTMCAPAESRVTPLLVNIDGIINDGVTIKHISEEDAICAGGEFEAELQLWVHTPPQGLTPQTRELLAKSFQTHILERASQGLRVGYLRIDQPHGLFWVVYFSLTEMMKRLRLYVHRSALSDKIEVADQVRMLFVLFMCAFCL